MRMRKKKHGAERIAACSRLLIPSPEALEQGFEPHFQNTKPIHLEIGCGKGNFVCAMAQKYLDVNFVAMEKVADVCCVALEKAQACAEERPEDNLRFFIGDAKLLADCAPPNSVDCIYLNFSDPWPKTGHAKRRLTHRSFLAIYHRLMREGGILKFKTDNVGLFDFSLEEFEACGLEILWQTRDLHASDRNADNIMTEYEKNFSEKGFSICSAWVRFPAYDEKHYERLLRKDHSMLKDLVVKNRSYRAFASDVPVPEERLRAWVDLARHCPSARNNQPLKYRIVFKPEELANIQPATYWAGSLGIQLPPIGQEPVAFIIICHDTEISPPGNFSMMDVGICAQTILLAATEEGFGGCMIGSFKADVVTQELGLADHLKPVLAIAFGVPNETVVLTEAKEGAVRYYRDENNVHYVPKRPLDEILL